jgi:hypothetical protein
MTCTAYQSCSRSHVLSGCRQDEYGDVTAYFSTKADVRHIWGVQYVMPTWPMGEEFFWQCKKVGSTFDALNAFQDVS